MFERLTEFVVQIVDALGYVGLALLIAVENLFPPIPSELILPLAGFRTAEGRFSYPLVVLATTIGSVIGALILYGVGHWAGQDRLRRLVRWRGHWLMLREEDLDKSEAWFDRYGTIAVLTGRVFPVVRSVISVPAGYRRMPLPTFVLLTTVGSAVWNGVLVGLGWALGNRWDQVEPYVDRLQYLVIAVVVLLVARFVWSRIRDRSGRPEVADRR